MGLEGCVLIECWDCSDTWSVSDVRVHMCVCGRVWPYACAHARDCVGQFKVLSFFPASHPPACPPSLSFSEPPQQQPTLVGVTKCSCSSLICFTKWSLRRVRHANKTCTIVPPILIGRGLRWRVVVMVSGTVTTSWWVCFLRQRLPFFR